LNWSLEMIASGSGFDPAIIVAATSRRMPNTHW